MNEKKGRISPGEFLDKIPILRIKPHRMTDPKRPPKVRIELGALEEAWRASAYASVDVGGDVSALVAVKERLWSIEDDIRDKERAKAFDDEFVRLARAVYIENDERAAI